MRFYQLMKAWKDSEDHDFNFHNAHDINSARDSSQEASIKKQLHERFANSKQLIVLIGEKNPLPDQVCQMGVGGGGVQARPAYNGGQSQRQPLCRRALPASHPWRIGDLHALPAEDHCPCHGPLACGPCRLSQAVQDRRFQYTDETYRRFRLAA
jgi:hypothetical protein